MNNWLLSLVDPVSWIAIEAGNAILAHDPATVSTQIKSDDSPVTAADILSNSIITQSLQRLTPNIPILSEEPSGAVEYGNHHLLDTQVEPELFWCIDPLDGTKGFLKQLGEYAVNIALIYRGNPVLGVIRVPAFFKTYRAVFFQGFTLLSQYQHDYQPMVNMLSLPAQYRGTPWRAASSGAYLGDSLQRFMNLHAIETRLHAHSALKFGWLMEGRADIFVRVMPTCGWDTAAGHCLLQSVGGDIVDYDGMRLRYHFYGPSWLNPSFVAVADAAILPQLKFDLLPQPHQQY